MTPRTRASLEERLWRSIEIKGPSDCWPWTMKSKIAGYGVIGRGKRSDGKVLAHRAVWEVTQGPIPDSDDYHGMVIMHTCDNRLCCNPAHLRLGTQSENVMDMDAKGRRKVKAHKGEKHHNSKLTADMVRALRGGSVSPEEISDRTGMLRKSVLRVKNDPNLWKHIH